MASPQQNPLSRQSSDSIPQSQQVTRNLDQLARSAGVPQRLRNDDSWVEISSQPSSSSLSSIGDEIVTTGLRVQHDTRPPRRRRQPGLSSYVGVEPGRTSTSSQEEYDESESEEDHDMTSSNEQIIPSTRLSAVPHLDDDAVSDSESDDENATALGRRPNEPAFTPQPNAFSHPPSSHFSQRPQVGSYFPPTSQPTPNLMPSYSNRSSSRTQHSSYNTTSSTHQAYHDAALRASLTTLLSIGAAAARGLPKRNQSDLSPNLAVNSSEPLGVRFVPESELVGAATNSSRPQSPSPNPRGSPSHSNQEAPEKGKRKVVSGGTRGAGEKARAAKKKKVQLVEEAVISPTLLAWVMSAGVVVLVSVVGFGAGYVIGMEVGRQEALRSLNSSTAIDGGSCGREVARGSGTLRRFKWGSGVTRSVVA